MGFSDLILKISPQQNVQESGNIEAAHDFSDLEITKASSKANIDGLDIKIASQPINNTQTLPKPYSKRQDVQLKRGLRMVRKHYNQLFKESNPALVRRRI
jgi:hypothetical protein